MAKARFWRYPLLMAALTLFLIWRIHLGLFHDEVQLINLGKLLADGDSFVQFTGYGMSHYLIRPLMALYHKFTGSYDGVFLYMRYFFVLIQLAVSIFTFTTLRLFWSEKQAASASTMVMLFVFSYYATAYKAFMFWCTMLTVLFLLRWEKTRKTRYLILSALALSADVLGYPPIPVLLIVPVTRFLLLERADARRTIAIFWGTCALCALAFLLPILLRWPFPLIREAYFAESLQTGRGFRSGLVKIGFAAALFLAAEAAVRIGERSGFFAKGGRRLWEALGALLWLALIGLVAMKPQSAQASRFWYVFLGFWMLMFSLRRHELLRVSHAPLVDILFFEVSVWMIAGIALISDQGLAIVAYGSIFGLIGVCIALLDGDNGVRYGHPGILAGCLVLAMLVCVTVFVADENMNHESSNVFQHRERIEDGAGKGLYVTAYTMEKHDALCRTARSFAREGDRMFIISDLMHPVGTMSADVAEAMPAGYKMESYLKTSAGVDYCARFPELAPTVVLVDTSYTGNFETWRKTAVFARWMDDRFEREAETPDGRWIVFRRLPES